MVPLLRRIFILESADQFDRSKEECLELLRALYGHSDSGDSLPATLTKDLTNDIGLTTSSAEPSLMFNRHDDGALIGIHGAYVDYFIRAGDAKFHRTCNVPHAKLETYNNEDLPFSYAGFEILLNRDGMVSVNQSHYSGYFKALQLPKTFSDVM